MTQIETNRAIEAVWRIEAARLIGGLTRLTRDVGQAEELAQDALVAALGDWPQNGIPKNAGAWLMQTAKRRFIDQFRRSKVLARSLPELTHAEELRQEDVPDYDARLDDDVKDAIGRSLEDRFSFLFTKLNVAGTAPLVRRFVTVADPLFDREVETLAAAGQITAARLEKQIKLLQEVGVLDKPVKVEDVATFEFIPKQSNQ